MWEGERKRERKMEEERQGGRERKRNEEGENEKANMERSKQLRIPIQGLWKLCVLFFQLS